MQEGILSLLQMAKTSALLARLAQTKAPFVSILTNPTTAGVMASYASLGDVIIAEPGALLGFAGRRVIEQTIGQKLPDDFQDALRRFPLHGHPVIRVPLHDKNSIPVHMNVPGAMIADPREED